MSVGNVLRVVKSAFKCQMQEFILRPHYCYVIVGQPILFMGLSVFLLGYSGKEHLIPHYLVSAGLIGVWNGNLFTSAIIVERERRDGTLPFLIASPTDLVWVLLGRSLANSVMSAIALFLSFLMAALLTHGIGAVSGSVLFLVSFLLTVVAVTVFGLWVACSFVWFRQAQRVAVLINWPVYLLSGVMLPLTTLPRPCRLIGYALAPTWGLKGMQASLTGNSGVSPYGIVAALVGLTYVYVALARRSYRAVLERVRKEGQLIEW